MSQSAKLLIDVFEKLQQLQETQMDLLVMIRATNAVVREKFPQADYEKYAQAASNSKEVKKLREQQRIARESIAAAKKQLLGEGNLN